jgi:hypothetical protein
MITSASGVQIPFPDKVEEKYISSENSIRLNISFEKIEPLINDFLLGLSEPLFLVIELPLKEQEEIKMKESNDMDFILKFYIWMVKLKNKCMRSLTYMEKYSLTMGCQDSE